MSTYKSIVQNRCIWNVYTKSQAQIVEINRGKRQGTNELTDPKGKKGNWPKYLDVEPNRGQNIIDRL